MTARTMIAAALVTCCGCMTELGSAGQIREQVDDYVIAKPLAQAWPDALRFLNARGFPPVGSDRKLIGLPEMGSWSTAASKGAETQRSGERWQADTAEDSRGKRYRVVGLELGPDSCRIGFFAVSQGGVVAPSEDRGRENVTRDASTELAFIETFDPAAAAKMKPKNPGFF
jgi:hypothetical protein